MQANPPEKVTRRVAVILEAGGSSRNLLDVVRRYWAGQGR